MRSTADVLVEAQSPDAVVAQFVHLRVFVFVCLCCSQLLLALVTCIDDPHRLECSIKTQVTAPCSRIVEQIVDVPVLQNSGLRKVAEQ